MHAGQPVFLNGATPCFLVLSGILFTTSVGLLIEADYSVAAAGIATSALGAGVSLFIVYGVRRKRKPLTKVVAMLAADLVLHLLLFGLACWRVSVNYMQWKRDVSKEAEVTKSSVQQVLSKLIATLNGRKLYSVEMSPTYHVQVAFALTGGSESYQHTVLVLILSFVSFCFCSYLLHVSIKQLNSVTRHRPLKTAVTEPAFRPDHEEPPPLEGERVLAAESEMGSNYPPIVDGTYHPFPPFPVRSHSEPERHPTPPSPALRSNSLEPEFYNPKWGVGWKTAFKQTPLKTENYVETHWHAGSLGIRNSPTADALQPDFPTVAPSRTQHDVVTHRADFSPPDSVVHVPPILVADQPCPVPSKSETPSLMAAVQSEIAELRRFTENL